MRNNRTSFRVWCLTLASERSDKALQHHEETAVDLLHLPTRQEFQSSTIQAVSETRAVERNIDGRIDRTETALLQRLDLLEQNVQRSNDHVVKTHDLQALRSYIDDRLFAQKSAASDAASRRLVLTLTIPQLQLSQRDAAVLYKRLSGEVEIGRAHV